MHVYVPRDYHYTNEMSTTKDTSATLIVYDRSTCKACPRNLHNHRSGNSNSGNNSIQCERAPCQVAATADRY